MAVSEMVVNEVAKLGKYIVVEGTQIDSLFPAVEFVAAVNARVVSVSTGQIIYSNSAECRSLNELEVTKNVARELVKYLR